MGQTVSTLKKMKRNGEKITMLTAYDYSTAKLIDEAGTDTILVGYSLGNVMLGYDTTIPVTVEDMIHHGRAVVRGTENALVIIDMPFLSYQTAVYDAVCNAGRIMKETGCAAVKLEGGARIAPQIKAITEAQIPVCGHIGLTPQSVNAFGGFKIQGKTIERAQQVIDDAKAVEEAGAFMVVLECVPAPLAKKVSESISIPTIGIGAGAGCDGQVLVYADMLGMFSDFVPKFVKKFGDVGQLMTQAFKDYNAAVKDGSFPDEEHEFGMDGEILTKLY